MNPRDGDTHYHMILKKKQSCLEGRIQYTYTFIKMARSLENTFKGWKMMFYRVSFLIVAHCKIRFSVNCLPRQQF